MLTGMVHNVTGREHADLVATAAKPVISVEIEGRRYRGKTAAERQNERREQLLDAGLELFGTLGFATTTILMLCTHTHLNPRYFYKEFGTKEALLGAIYERHVQLVAEEVLAAIDATPAEPRPRLEAGLRAFFDAVLADRRAARINYFEMVGVSAELEQRRRSVLRAYAELIAGQLAAMADRVRLAPDAARRFAIALVGATDGLVIASLSEEDGSGDEAAILATLLAFVDPLLDRIEQSE
jgi:AcrR family transcriptional regulator